MSCPSCVGVVGIGYMGRSIVAAILAHTRSSILCYDNSETAEKKCREYVKASIEELIKRLPKYSAETSVGWCTLNATSVLSGIFDNLIKGLFYQMQTVPKESKCINNCMCK